jgi:hypothetical protein
MVSGTEAIYALLHFSMSPVGPLYCIGSIAFKKIILEFPSITEVLAKKSYSAQMK